jgi:hypothetical protein
VQQRTSSRVGIGNGAVREWISGAVSGVEFKDTSSSVASNVAGLAGKLATSKRVEGALV